MADKARRRKPLKVRNCRGNLVQTDSRPTRDGGEKRILVCVYAYPQPLRQPDPNRSMVILWRSSAPRQFIDSRAEM